MWRLRRRRGLVGCFGGVWVGVERGEGDGPGA